MTDDGAPPTPHLQAVTDGNAAAALPVPGHVIATPATSLHTAWKSVTTGDGAPLPVYLAKPLGHGPFPVILVIHEMFGVHEHIADIVRRLALLGYCACAPQLFFRLGDPQQAVDAAAIQRDFVTKTGDLQVLNDIDNALDWCALQGGDPGRVGVTGFCWGGRIAWLYAAHHSQLQAAVAWYGRLDGPTSELMPQQPIAIASTLVTPVLGLYGGKDPSIPPADIAAQRAALESTKRPCEIVVYPDASHAFFADYRASYDPAAATNAWYRMLSWFQQHGVR